MTDVQKILGVIVTLVGLAGGLVKYVQDQSAFRQRVTQVCHRHLQLESLFLKYYPAETASLYYPGAPTVCP